MEIVAPNSQRTSKHGNGFKRVFNTSSQTQADPRKNDQVCHGNPAGGVVRRP